MTLLSIQELHLLAPETKPVPQDALQLLLDTAEAQINGRIGAVGNRVERHVAHGRIPIILDREGTAIVSVTEDGATVASTEYTLTGNVLRRGDIAWDGEIIVTYTPVADLNLRKRVQADLVRLDLAYSGYQSESAPAFSRTRADIDKQRHELLAGLAPKWVAL